jgi:hypothetical protein
MGQQRTVYSAKIAAERAAALEIIRAADERRAIIWLEATARAWERWNNDGKEGDYQRYFSYALRE